jgi:DUF4097 and DUF4098 domain-containing protein YvlB
MKCSVRGCVKSYIVLCVAAGAVLAGCALTEGFKYSGDTTTTEVAPLAGVKVVEFKLGSDDLEVVSKDVAEATFIIKKTWKANDADYGKKLLAEAEITIEREGDKLVVMRKRSTTRGTLDMITKGYVSIDITATIPAGLGLDIGTGSGDVDLDDRQGPVKVSSGSGDVVAGNMRAGFEMSTGSGDLHLGFVTGPCKFSAGSGDLTLDGVKGSLEATTGSGDQDIDKVTGDVRISTGSGDVGLGSVEGNLNIGTSSGDISVLDHTGEADIGTSSGDVTLRDNSHKGLVKVHTSSGDVDIGLYAVDSVRLDIRTSTGVIRVKLPLVVEEASREHLVARSGSGDLKIDVMTTSGDISLKQGSI